MAIHARLKAARFPNCRKIAEELEVSPKTIQRDIDFMRYRLALPIEYDPLRFGFYYTEAVTSFPRSTFPKAKSPRSSLRKRLWRNIREPRSSGRSARPSGKSPTG